MWDNDVFKSPPLHKHKRCSSLAKTSVSADNDHQADSDFFPHTTRADELTKQKFQHLDNFSPPDKLDARSANFFAVW